MINIEAFTKLIRGLKYNKKEDTFVYRNNSYKLKGVKQVQKGKSLHICFFVNTDNASDIRKVQMKGELPTYDDFNRIKIKHKKREQVYQHLYYERKIKIKRKVQTQEVEEAKKFFTSKKKKLNKMILNELAEEQKLEKAKNIKPKYCQECGKKFIPRQHNQRFCSTPCRRKYYHTQQAKENSLRSRSIKTCPVCGIQFEGYKNEKYCSEKCKKNKNK